MNQNLINIQHKNKSPNWGFIFFNNVLVLKIIVKNYLHNHLHLIFGKILKIIHIQKLVEIYNISIINVVNVALRRKNLMIKSIQLILEMEKQQQLLDTLILK